jgi:uncharacterized membrane protein (DUF106 family)
MALGFNIIGAVFRILFYPFEHLHPAWGMIWISLLAGILMLIVFRFTSNQEGIKKSKAKVSAYILEMRLFNHDLGKMLAALGKTLAANILYLRYMIVPIIVIIVPVLLILIEVSYRYEYRPLRPDEPAIVKAVLKPGSPVIETHISLQVPDNIKIETPALRIKSSNEVDWRISAREHGIYQLRFLVDGRLYKKNLHVNNELTALSRKRIGSSYYAFLLNHAEPELSNDSPFVSLEIMYPDRSLSIMGLRLHWIIWFFIFSVISGFAFKNVFKVEL